ncbi:MAG: hypothetical protein E7571_08775 [Ruminococcaceae bacterium]|nr:hypothetical protein [Oscillospiraceae bacterium]
MKSDVIHISSDGTGIAEALKQAEAVAVYKSLPQKKSVHLLILAEEMTGMIKAITGELAADFWIETVEDVFQLHLKTNTAMNSEKREKLLAVSTSGKNETKGFMSKVKSAFESVIGSMERNYADAVGLGLVETSGVVFSEWTLTQYKKIAKGDDWDELERSVVANLADEVKVCINGSDVELIIEKKM